MDSKKEEKRWKGEAGNKEVDSKFDYVSKKYLPFGVEYVPIKVKDFSISLGKGAIKRVLNKKSADCK